MDKIKLKSYPFCGKAAQIVNGCGMGFFVECSKLGHLHNVGVLGGTFCKNEQEAADDWNKRANEYISYIVQEVQNDTHG